MFSLSCLFCDSWSSRTELPTCVVEPVISNNFPSDEALKKELNIKDIRLFLGAQKPFFVHLLEHKPKLCSKHHVWSILRYFCVFEWWIQTTLAQQKWRLGPVYIIVVNKLCFQSFLPQQKKALACHGFFWIDWPWGSSVEDTAKPRKCCFDPRNDRSRWWFQPIWKIQMGLFPQIGVKIPKIFELPPPSFNVGRGWKRSVR